MEAARSCDPRSAATTTRLWAGQSTCGPWPGPGRQSEEEVRDLESKEAGATDRAPDPEDSVQQVRYPDFSQLATTALSVVLSAKSVLLASLSTVAPRLRMTSLIRSA